MALLLDFGFLAFERSCIEEVERGVCSGSDITAIARHPEIKNRFRHWRDPERAPCQGESLEIITLLTLNRSDDQRIIGDNDSLRTFGCRCIEMVCPFHLARYG